MAVSLPKSVVGGLEKGLELYGQGLGGKGLVDETIRLARQGVRTGQWPEWKIVKASNWFARHVADRRRMNDPRSWNKPPRYSPAYVAWALWGDDGSNEGKRWIDKEAKRLKARGVTASPRSNPTQVSAKSLIYISLGLIAVSFIFRKRVAKIAEGLFPAEKFSENRVRVADYASLPANDPRLVGVPSVHGKNLKLHKLAASRFNALRSAAEKAGFPDVRVASGHRVHRWRSREQYENEMRRRYGSVREGRRWMAYNSPHETGLAVDFGSHGIWPTKSGNSGPFGLSNQEQKQTPFYLWLKENAHLYGFTPYKTEAWHWEVRLPRLAWENAQEFTNNFAVRV